MSEDWLGRWDQGRIGWHEAAGNEGLKSHWPVLPDGSSVLVPLCGKAPDLLWLAKRGHVVVGVELSDIAVAAFFAEHELEFNRESCGTLDRYTAKNYPITVYCGDYFSFQSATFDTAVTISVFSQQPLMPCTTVAPWSHYRMSSTPGNFSGLMLHAW